MADEQKAKSANANTSTKKPYHKPEFRFDRVFETRALICGKAQATQFSCVHNRRTS